MTLNFTVLRDKRFTLFNYNLLLLKEDNSKVKQFKKNCFLKKNSRNDESESRSTQT